MTTREQVIADLTEENPFTRDDEGNAHYPGSPFYDALMQQWADNRMAQIENPPPTVVTRRQFRLALLGEGISPSMLAEVIEGDHATTIEWEEATYVASNSPLVATLADRLGLDGDDIRSIFDAATEL